MGKSYKIATTSIQVRHILGTLPSYCTTKGCDICDRDPSWGDESDDEHGCTPAEIESKCLEYCGIFFSKATTCISV